MQRKSLAILKAVVFSIVMFITSICAYGADPYLSWDESTGEVDGYKIYYGIAATGMTSTKDVGLANTYFLKNLSLADGVKYYFGVKAYNEAGESAMSNVVSWTWVVLKPPGPPPNVQVRQ